MPVFPSYINHSIDFTESQLTGFYMRATLGLNGLKKNEAFVCNKHKIAVKWTIHQNSAVSKAFLDKF